MKPDFVHCVNQLFPVLTIIKVVDHFIKNFSVISKTVTIFKKIA